MVIPNFIIYLKVYYFAIPGFVFEGLEGYITLSEIGSKGGHILLLKN